MRAMIKLVLADAVSYQKLISDDKIDLSDYREAIDKIDEDIIINLKKRNEISKAIGKYKEEHSLPVTDTTREEELTTILMKKAESIDLDSKDISAIWAIILSMSKKQQ